MEKTTRRHLLRAAAVGGVTATGLIAALGAKEQAPGSSQEHAHDNNPFTGPRAHVLVSFGQWDVDPARPFDRHPINTATENRTRNVHLLLPFEVDIDAGGAVSFVISGVHQILIYAGRTLAEVQAGFKTSGTTLPPVPPGLVEYTPDRVYRGLNPFALQYQPLAEPQADTPNNMVVDRVEGVNFKEPGRYLVVCGVVPHFNEGMHGYVNVHA